MKKYILSKGNFDELAFREARRCPFCGALAKKVFYISHEYDPVIDSDIEVAHDYKCEICGSMWEVEINDILAYKTELMKKSKAVYDVTVKEE